MVISVLNVSVVFFSTFSNFLDHCFDDYRTGVHAQVSRNELH